MKYPLGEYEREKITSKTGKKLDDINLEEIKKGNITGEDIKISRKCCASRVRWQWKLTILPWRAILSAQLSLLTFPTRSF